MKIFRGPASKQFEYMSTPNNQYGMGDEHELVDQVDVGAISQKWKRSIKIPARIDKNATEKRSVIHIILEAKDVIELHNGLVKGLLEASEKSDDAFNELSSIGLTAS